MNEDLVKEYEDKIKNGGFRPPILFDKGDLSPWLAKFLAKTWLGTGKTARTAIATYEGDWSPDSLIDWLRYEVIETRDTDGPSSVEVYASNESGEQATLEAEFRYYRILEEDELAQLQAWLNVNSK